MTEARRELAWEDMIEDLAINLAEANNGGTWATHYQEKQKDVWRDRARKWSDDVIDALIEAREPGQCPVCGYEYHPDG